MEEGTTTTLSATIKLTPVVLHQSGNVMNLKLSKRFDEVTFARRIESGVEFPILFWAFPDKPVFIMGKAMRLTNGLDALLNFLYLGVRSIGDAPIVYPLHCDSDEECVLLS